MLNKQHKFIKRADFGKPLTKLVLSAREERLARERYMSAVIDEAGYVILPRREKRPT